MKKTEYLYSGLVKRVVDGDTVDIVVDLGFSVNVEMRFRLYGIDTPEKNDPSESVRELAIKASQWATTELTGKTVTIKSHSTDKYGRYLAEVFLGERDINKELITLGLARSYHGEKKTPW